jgi:hypothetical protein
MHAGRVQNGLAVIIDVHVHPVSRDLVHDPRHRAFMDRAADCLAPHNAIDLLVRYLAK